MVDKPVTAGLPAHILDRFEISRQIGHGAYGLVYQATDKSSGQVVALKRCVKVLTNTTDAHRTLREIAILAQLRRAGHPNLVLMTHAMAEPRMRADLYLGFEFFDGDMRSGIRSALFRTRDAVMQVIVQVGCGLQFLAKSQLLHRDLKPENLLVSTATRRVVIADFGLARCSASLLTDDVEQKQSEGTLPYMAPELLLEIGPASFASDVWAFGIIMGELFRCGSLLRGRKKMDYLRKILELIGPPDDQFISQLESEYLPQCLELERCIEALEGKNPTPGSPECWAETFEMAEPLDMELLQAVLAMDPKHRPSIDEIMAHPALASHLGAAEEGMAVNAKGATVLKVPLDGLDPNELDIQQLRETIDTLVRKEYSSGCCTIQ